MASQSLNQVLSDLNITTKPGKNGKKFLVNALDRIIFYGNASEVWLWLEESNLFPMTLNF